MTAGRVEALLRDAPRDLAALPAWLLRLRPKQAQRVCVGAVVSIALDGDEPPDWRHFERIVRAYRAQWRRAEGDATEHAAMLAELEALTGDQPRRPQGAPPTMQVRRQRLGTTQRRVLERAYRLVPRVGDTAAVRWNFPDRDDRKTLARMVRWAPGLEWRIEVEADGLEEPCILRTKACAAEVRRLLGVGSAGGKENGCDT